MARRVYCADMNWLAVDGLPEPLEVTVRLRHSKTELAAVARAHGENVVLEMHTPARAPTPGQLAVLYLGDVVAASGWITGADRTVPGP